MNDSPKQPLAKGSGAAEGNHMTGTVSRRGWGRILGVLACADRNARCQPNTSAMGDSYNALALTNLSGSAARVVAESVTRQDFGGGGR